MKKIILLILTSILFASNTVVLKKRQKETNNSVIKEELILRKWLINKINSVLPDYLQAEPKENMINFSLKYDTRKKKLTSNLNLRLIFPSLEGKYQKSTETKTKTIKLKLIPILLMHRQKPCPTLKASFTFQNRALLKNLTFNETLYYYTVFTEYKEISTVTLDKFIAIDNLTFKISKIYLSTDKTNLYYYAGLYYYTDFFKFVRIYGYEMGGERKKLPFIYWQKLFFTYRKILFNKRYIFFDFTPYLYYSKEYDYKPKFFVSTSLNLKF
jgi:hypothetical protein